MLKWIIRLSALWSIIFMTFLGIAVSQEPEAIGRAFYGMTLGLVLLWIVLCGGGMVFLRKPIRQVFERIPLNWRLKFVLFCILLAMLEEAITTSMTTLAPFFGVAYGQAYITASGNYLDVIFFHSVVVFVPMFIAWAWLLSHYDFKPLDVFFCFGLTGLLAESISFGLQNFINFGFWLFVYGLMIYLPAYCLPERPAAKSPRWWHYPLAIVLPIIAAILVIIVLELGKSIMGIPAHPPIHFAAIG